MSSHVNIRFEHEILTVSWIGIKRLKDPTTITLPFNANDGGQEDQEVLPPDVYSCINSSEYVGTGVRVTSF